MSTAVNRSRTGTRTAKARSISRDMVISRSESAPRAKKLWSGSTSARPGRAARRSAPAPAPAPPSPPPPPDPARRQTPRTRTHADTTDADTTDADTTVAGTAGGVGGARVGPEPAALERVRGQRDPPAAVPPRVLPSPAASRDVQLRRRPPQSGGRAGRGAGGTERGTGPAARRCRSARRPRPPRPPSGSPRRPGRTLRRASAPARARAGTGGRRRAASRAGGSGRRGR